MIGILRIVFKMMKDLGCGTGSGLPFLLNKWPKSQVTAIDSSPEMLGKAREFIKHDPRVHFEQCSIEEYVWKEEVTCFALFFRIVNLK